MKSTTAAFRPRPAAGKKVAARTKNNLRLPARGVRHAAERLFLESLEANPDAVVLVDETGAILHSNALIQDVFGYRRDELLGRPLQVLIPDRFRDRHAGHLARYFSTARTRRMGEALELKGLRKDGSEFPIDVALSPVHADGKLVVAAAIRDMSVYRKLEAELRQRGQDLEEADRLKDQFLATLAHELRNPLAALSLAGQRLRLPDSADRIGFVADVIDKETAHMTRLVEELFDIARIRQGKVNLRMEILDLVAVVAHAVDTSRTLIERRGHALDIVQPRVPIPVHGDETRLCQVIVNLLTNAARYTPEGGHILLTLDKDDHDAIVRVRDTGVGIAADMLPRVFDLFTQVQHPEIDADGGLGIGLALVMNLVALHGGTVAVSSDGPGKGSEFVVRIPLLVEH